MTGRGLPPANWFVALAVPAGPWWEDIPPPPQGVRLFAAQDLHLTVAFLGPVGVRAAEAAFELASRWPLRQVEATLGHVKPMGNPRRPNALSAVVVDGREAIASAMLAVRDEMCERAGARTDDRAPLPHVTIARPLRRASNAEQKAAVAWARSVDLGNPRVVLKELVLFTRSDDRSVRLFQPHASHTV